jgi:hypothetical protein
MIVALTPHENTTHFQKTMGINDFYFETQDYPFPMGHIQMLRKSDKFMFKADAAAFVPAFILDILAKRSIDFWLTTEDLPDPNNRYYCQRAMEYNSIIQATTQYLTKN